MQERCLIKRLYASEIKKPSFFSVFVCACECACELGTLSVNTHSQNSVTGEVKLVALAVSQRVLFLRTVSSIQCSVFQG